MNSCRHIDNFAFEPLGLECCVIPGCTDMWRITLWCYFFNSKSNTRSNVKYQSVISDVEPLTLHPSGVRMQESWCPLLMTNIPMPYYNRCKGHTAFHNDTDFPGEMSNCMVKVDLKQEAL